MQDPTTERGVSTVALLARANKLTSDLSNQFKKLLEYPTALTPGVYVVSLQQSAISSPVYVLTITYNSKPCTFVKEDPVWHLTNSDPYKINVQAIVDRLSTENLGIDPHVPEENSKELTLTFTEYIDITHVQCSIGEFLTI